MTITIPEKKKYTYDDYLKTPEDKRYELIDGELLMTPAPFTNQQRISKKLVFLLDTFITENKRGEILYAPCDVYFDHENVVQPDILFISKERLHIIGEKNIQGAPDLAIEILSEYSVYRDVVQKKRLYAKFGVKEYWVVIPEEKEIEVYTLKDTVFHLHKLYSYFGALESPLLKGLTIELNKIF